MASEVGKAKLPFGLGTLDFRNNPSGSLFAVFALILGAVVWNMADSIGSNYANKVNRWLSNVLGVELSGGSRGARGV